jgi:preprotein translocase SecE subunit
MSVGVYKGSQGRITRQVTFAALALAIALGLYRLSGVLVGWDPIIVAGQARVTCTTKTGHLETDAKIKVTGTAGSAVVEVQAAEKLPKVAEAINAHSKATGVVARMDDNKLALSSVVVGKNGTIKLDAPAGLWQTEGLEPDGVARGRDSLNLGLHFLIPGLLLALGVWASYRAVNLPALADFLIAVEAEMNKVSWPTRGELFRASTVVLILIFALAFVLPACDIFWKGLLTLLHIV